MKVREKLAAVCLIGLLILGGCAKAENENKPKGQVGETQQTENKQPEIKQPETKQPEVKKPETEAKPGQKPKEEPVVKVNKNHPVATIYTEKGNIVLELYPDYAPKTVANFIKLSKKGFYNGLTFHRVEPGFVIQGGDPAGNGTGGPGYTIPAEFTNLTHKRGTLAMARRPDNVNSGGSQFYITLADVPQLDGQYTVFGYVLKGMDVVDKIEVGDVMKKITIQAK